MDIQKEREAFENWHIRNMDINSDFEKISEQDSPYMDEHVNNSWLTWQAAKAQAVPEGFVLVEKAKIKTWFQDDDEPENFCSEESEIADLADPYETGEIIKINRIEDCVISVTPLYGTWKIDRIDQEGDVHRSFVLCDSYYEAEKVIVSNKEVDDEWLLAQQAQEPAND